MILCKLNETLESRFKVKMPFTDLSFLRWPP